MNFQSHTPQKYLAKRVPSDQPAGRRSPLAPALLLAALLTGCAIAPGAAPLDPPQSKLPPAWNAPLPHGGNTTDLARWWQSLGDPLLVELIESAQAVSPGVASATSRIAQSRAALGIARGANQPSLDASVSAQRGVNASSPTPGTLLQSNLGASWEIDLFGANREAATAAQARLQGSNAQWHEARVSVAAETATTYFSWRTCSKLLEVARQDAASRAETARLSELSAQTGLTAPAVAALARASAAEGNARATQQQAQCDSALKALVALTAIPEPTLRDKLQSSPGDGAERAMPAVSSVPAEVLSQRPDLYAAERDVAAASAELGSAEAQRYPRLMLNGSIGTLNFSNSAGTTDLSTWSVGPITLTLPLLDGGRRAANVEAARARYQEAAALYQARARMAVREVEDALLMLATTSSQQADARRAAEGYAASFNATQARYQAGAASLPELEDARRWALNAQTTLLQLELQHTSAWIALYRALGGGWNANAVTPQDKS